MGDITLILGGAKSGKTTLALDLCNKAPAVRIYLATAQAHDREMADRIARHQAERGPEWVTVEEPFDPAAYLAGLRPGQASVVLLDCLTLWLSNLMAGRNMTVDECAAEGRRLARAALDAPCPVVMVGNEVGLGIVPDNRLARDFRDAAGVIHQGLARDAREVFFVVAGLAQRLK